MSKEFERWREFAHQPSMEKAWEAGRALGRREVKGDSPSAWLITGSKIYQDSVAVKEEWADIRIKERNDSTSHKVPLYQITAVLEE